jgi:hypothetical protein
MPPCARIPALTIQLMPKSAPGSEPDPMARVVDRLLAQLENSGPRPSQDPAPSRTGPPGQQRVTPRKSRSVVRSAKAPSRKPLIALWAGLLLGITLGGAMTQWPYPRGCDLPLVGYLGAVSAVIAAGGSSALAAWRLRSGAAHVLSLILLFWGIVLAAERVLPRVGYAAERASWRCLAVPATSLAGSIAPARGSGPASPESPSPAESAARNARPRR